MVRSIWQFMCDNIFDRIMRLRDAHCCTTCEHSHFHLVRHRAYICLDHGMYIPFACDKHICVHVSLSVHQIDALARLTYCHGEFVTLFQLLLHTWFDEFATQKQRASVCLKLMNFRKQNWLFFSLLSPILSSQLNAIVCMNYFENFQTDNGRHIHTMHVLCSHRQFMKNWGKKNSPEKNANES